MVKPRTQNLLIQLRNNNGSCIYITSYELSGKFVYVDASIFIHVCFSTNHHKHSLVYALRCVNALPTKYIGASQARLD